MSLDENYKNVVQQIPENVTLVAVSKTQPVSEIQKLYDLGQRDFGENRVQELLEKQSQLPSDIRWHQIGHLQTNKVKLILPFVHLIQSLDSEKLLEKIDAQAALNGQNIAVLLQLKIAQEDTKFGLTVKEAEVILERILNNDFPNITIKGLMGMASFTDDEQIVRAEFQTLKKQFDKWKSKYKFDILSMGMSDDFLWAIEEGSSMVRVGSKIFERR